MYSFDACLCERCQSALVQNPYKDQPLKETDRCFQFQLNLRYSSVSELVNCEAIHFTITDMLSLSFHYTMLRTLNPETVSMRNCSQY